MNWQSVLCGMWMVSVGANMNILNGVGEFDVFMDSWHLRLQLPDTSVENWDELIPFVCGSENCSSVEFTPNGPTHMMCKNVSALVKAVRFSWIHERSSECSTRLQSCISHRGDCVHMRPPLSLFVREDCERARRYNVSMVRLLLIQYMDIDRKVCLVRSADVSFVLPERVVPLASIVASDPCSGQGLLGPPGSVVREVSVGVARACIWLCPVNHTRHPWNSAPSTNQSTLSGYACVPFPLDFVAILASLELKVPNWWRVGDLTQEFFDEVDLFAKKLEGRLRTSSGPGKGLRRLMTTILTRLSDPMVSCTVRGSVYSVMRLLDDIRQHVTYDERPGMQFEIIKNTESIFQSFKHTPGSLRIDCRAITSDILLQPEMATRIMTTALQEVMHDGNPFSRGVLIKWTDVEAVVRYVQKELPETGPTTVIERYEKMGTRMVTLIAGIGMFAMIVVASIAVTS